MNPVRLPVAAELFAQWCRARGGRLEPSGRPFSRAWEKLLDDAGQLSALERGEAERDARALAETGWLKLKTPSYRTHIIERVLIPRETESRWMEAFGYQAPTDEAAREIREFPWVPALEFLRITRSNIPFAELRQLNDYLLKKGAQQTPIPIKERSLQIFGDEKRLDALADSALIRDDRLPWAALDCYHVVEPLGWRRGPTNTGSVIVLENAATWDSFRRWNAERKLFSAVINGQGNRFAERVTFLHEVFRELGGPQTIFYFGDLDAAGLKIPVRASRKARQEGLPGVEPHLPSYELLLACANRKTKGNPDDPARQEDYAWLGPLAQTAWQTLGEDQRLAQEHVGWDILSRR